MFDKEITYNVVSQIIETIHIVQKRTKNINSVDDFTSSEKGMIVLDSHELKTRQTSTQQHQ